MIALIFAVSSFLLALGYIFYGKFLEKQYNIDSCRLTPAHSLKDDIDYIPTEPPILFGHHFSSIAGAVPIVGPILAASAFGWLPPLLWLVVGAVFIGGVHDFSALVASIRHKAKSIAELFRIYLSTTTYKLFLIFVWVALVYILIVFVDMTATTFAPPTGAVTDINMKKQIIWNGGVVATASVGYIILAVIFGLLLRFKKINLKIGTLIFVPLVFATLWLAEYFPITSDIMPAVFGGDSKNTWTIILIIYCFAASLLPVWLLLQPRDYLSSFLLFGCVAVGGVGMLIASITGKVSLQYPAFIAFEDRTLGYIFPALFITVACGAVSGFHAIVASGTTAKQLPRECAAKPVAYGSMLVETALALVALGCIMMAVKPGATPQITFATGLGTFLSTLGLPQSVGVTFALLALSTFLLTTLDTCSRLGRYILEEVTNLQGWMGKISATIVTLIIPACVVFIKIPDPAVEGAFLSAWRAVFPVFGATNQLLAVFALLAVFIWRVRQKKSYWFIIIPMIFMMSTTFTQLFMLVSSGYRAHHNLIMVLSAALLIIAILLLADAVRTWKQSNDVLFENDSEKELTGAT